MITFEKLFKAYRDCCKHKRGKNSQITFEFNQERNLVELYAELTEGRYIPDYSICFIVIFPKVREVWAANFRDRIVHHLIYNEIKDRFYNRFTIDTFSCIPKRGTGTAQKRLEKYAREITCGFKQDAYYLKADIKNFFVSIRKDILMKQIEEHVSEEWVLDLCRKVIYNDPRENARIQSPEYKFEMLPKHKSLWYTPNDKGLPIGNLTSQFFSNVYLNKLDQYVKHKLRCKYYCRYVDDFIILDKDPHKLHRIHKELTEFLFKELKLELHTDKREINKISKGIDFVGFQTKTFRTYLRQKTIKRVFKLIRIHKKAPYDPDEIKSFIASVNSYLGMLRNINGYKMRREICLQSIDLFIGCDEEFTKLYLRCIL